MPQYHNTSMNTIITVLLIVFAIAAQLFASRDELQKMKPSSHGAPVEEENTLTILEISEEKVKKLRRKAESETNVQGYRPVWAATPSPKEERLANALQPQGVGVRFEASPGTFDSSQIVTPSVEPTINPNLESMTGAFDVQTPTNDFFKDRLGLRQLLTTPKGIRQAVILSEIMKRPEF